MESARASNQFKIVVIGFPNTGSTHFIHRILNNQFTQQTKRFRVYNCAINTATLEWKEVAIGYQHLAKDKLYIRAVIFEVIATKTIIDLLYLLIAPEDVILLAYDPSLLNTASYMADIDYILNFVSAHCSTKCCSSAMHSSHFPVVLMVGIRYSSHAVNSLRDYCHGKIYEKHILWQSAFSFIDDIKKAILSTASPLYTQHCPSVYLQFEKAILELPGNQLSLTMVKALEIAKKAGIETTEELFEHCRNKGIILYYPKIKKLFISPQMVMNFIVFVFELPDYSSLQEALTHLGPKIMKLLVYLLKSFNLVVAGHWSFSKASKAGFCYNNTQFIIPALVDKKIAPKKYIKPMDYVGIIHYFPDQFLPKCIFYQLMIKLIDWFHYDDTTINW